MFDPRKPYNQLPLLPPKFDFDDADILKQVNKSNMALARLEGLISSISNSSLLIEPLSVREAVASSEIENINTTVEEIFRAELLAEREITREQKETQYYREALDLGFKMILEKDFLNTNSFIEIQKVIEPNQSGIRRIPVTIRNRSTDEVLYTPPVVENNLRELLKNLEDYYNNFSDGIDPLIKMAVLHYQFEAIHPFYDGNGRTGRILMVLYLILAKRLTIPILFLSGFILKNRSDYYNLLRDVTAGSGWKDWIIFILMAVELQALETSVTVNKIRQLQYKYKTTIKKKLPRIYSADLVDYLFANPFYRQSKLTEHLGIHRNTSRKYLNSLVENGLLLNFKYKREKIYFNQEFLEILK